MILAGIDTRPTWEAMKRGEWPAPNPQVKAAWERLARLEFAEIGKGQGSGPSAEEDRRSDDSRDG